VIIPTVEQEIKERISAGNKAYFAHKMLFMSKKLSKKSKLKFYNSVIRPIVTYASETWVLKKKKILGLSPQANYTDLATAACRRSWCQPLRVEGVAWSAQRIPTAVNLGFVDRSRYFFIQGASQFSSQG
jgi:hypothetical protein